MTIERVPETVAIPVDDHRYRIAVAVNQLADRTVAAIDDSTAATVGDLVADFNALLAAMRASGVMDE